MARVTVEDCIVTVPNRFELVLLASKRSRELSAGAPLTVARDNDKNAVVSLRELSENSIDLQSLRDRLLQSMQRNSFAIEQEDDVEHDITEGLDSESEAHKNSLVERDLLLDDSLNIDDDMDDEDESLDDDSIDEDDADEDA